MLCLIWGSTWLAIKAGLRDLPPLTSAAVRFSVAATLFALLTPLLLRREGGARPPLRLILVMGLCNFAVPYGVVYWGETVIPSGLAAVLWAVFPMIVALLSHLGLPGERLRVGHWLGFTLGLVGVALLVLTDLRGIGPAAIRAGVLFLLSPLVSAVGNVLIKRDGERYSSLLLNRGGLVVGALLLCLAALATERDLPSSWSATAVLSVLYLAGPGTVVTFGLYFWALRYAPAHKMSLIAYVIPVVALALGWALGDEPITLHTVAGAALVLLGVALVLRSRPRGPRARPSLRSRFRAGPVAGR